MTIAIAIGVPDGIALAADTQTTWTQTITKAKQKDTGEEFELESPIVIPVGSSRMAKKLFPLKFGEHQFAVCSAGSGSLNSKSMYAVFKSLETTYEGKGDCREVVEYLIKGVQEELKLHLGQDDLSTAPTLRSDFIIAGYEGSDVSKPFIESHLVFSGEMTIDGKKDSSGHRRAGTNTEGNYRYGGRWIGRTDFVSHIVRHQNPALPQIQGQFHLMTLADAVDYTKFLVEFTCDFQRFAVTVPDCGRPIISASLTPGKYEERIV